MRGHALLIGLVLAGSACGRIGVELLPSELPPDDEEGEVDVPRIVDDAGARSDGPSNDVDGSAPLGEAVDAGADAHDAALAPNTPTRPLEDASTLTPEAGADATVDVAPHDASAAGDPGRAGDASSAEAGTRADDAGARDAATAADAQSPRADASASSCAGASVFGLCWYLSRDGDSCNDTCASHGGYDSRAASYVGTDSQGGSVGECTQILRALGSSSRVGEGMRSDDYGFGCHLWSDGAAWWLASPRFRPEVRAEGSGVAIACGCVR